MVMLVDKYGDKYWNQLQLYMEGKTLYDCFHTYRKKLNKSRAIRKYFIFEDYFLGLGVCLNRKNTNGKNRRLTS